MYRKNEADLETCNTTLMDERAKGYQAQINSEASDSHFLNDLGWLAVGIIAGYAVHEVYR